MSVNGEVSEQVVRLSLEGFEVFARLTGSGAKNVAAMIYTIMKDKNQTKGKIKLNNLLKTGKPLKIFTIKKDDLKIFAKESKNYGISYCALMDRKSDELDGMVDIMVKDEDAGRINRIVERFKLTTVDTAKVKTVVTKSIEEREEKNKELGVKEKSKEEQLEEVLSEKTTQNQANNLENFNMAMSEKSHQSEPLLEMQREVSNIGVKPSIRKELAKLKVKANELKEQKIKEKSLAGIVPEIKINDNKGK